MYTHKHTYVIFNTLATNKKIKSVHIILESIMGNTLRIISHVPQARKEKIEDLKNICIIQSQHIL